MNLYIGVEQPCEVAVRLITEPASRLELPEIEIVAFVHDPGVELSLKAIEASEVMP